MKIYNDVTIIIIYAFLDLNFGVYIFILKHSFLRNQIERKPIELNLHSKSNLHISQILNSNVFSD